MFRNKEHRAFIKLRITLIQFILWMHETFVQSVEMVVWLSKTIIVSISFVVVYIIIRYAYCQKYTITSQQKRYTNLTVFFVSSMGLLWWFMKGKSGCDQFSEKYTSSSWQRNVNRNKEGELQHLNNLQYYSF